MSKYIDYSVPEFWELGTYCFFGAVLGAILAVLLFLAVVYLPL